MTKEDNKKLNLTKVLFIIYCILLVWIILFKLSISFNDILGLDKSRNINLIPFYYSNDVGFYFHFREVLDNLLVFVPFGIYLKMLNKDNKKIIVCGFAFSLVLEICQFIFKLGATDITDLITNTLGTIIGVYIYVILEKTFKNKEKINKILKILSLIGTIMICSLLLLLIFLNQ